MSNYIYAGPKIDFVPSDVRDVIIKDNTVVVNLIDGRKGVAKAYAEDNFDPFVGFSIAYFKAKNKKVYHVKKALDGCVNAAKKRGYSHAILKNYDRLSNKSITSSIKYISY